MRSPNKSNSGWFPSKISFPLFRSASTTTASDGSARTLQGISSQGVSGPDCNSISGTINSSPFNGEHVADMQASNVIEAIDSKIRIAQPSSPAAVTEPPPKSQFQLSVIVGSGSPLCSARFRQVETKLLRCSRYSFLPIEQQSSWPAPSIKHSVANSPAMSLSVRLISGGTLGSSVP